MNITYLAKIHGRFGWNDSPLTRADFDSKFTSILFVWVKIEFGQFINQLEICQIISRS